MINMNKEKLLLAIVLIVGCGLFKTSYNCQIYVYWDDDDYSSFIETPAWNEFYDAFSEEEAQEVCEDEHGPYYEGKRLARCRCFD